jgi:hypothetical protein
MLLLVPACLDFYFVRASDASSGSRLPRFSPCTGIRCLFWFPLPSFFTLDGHQIPLLVPASLVFHLGRASDASSGSRFPHFSPWTGIRCLFWFPLPPFFTLDGHHLPLLVPASLIFHLGRASDVRASQIAADLFES